MTKDSIFLLKEDQLTALAQTDFISEEDLSRMLADHPELLAGAQIDPNQPRRWLLVKKEKSLATDTGGAARWWVDHLFLDQDGIPTLVEVKRGANPELRRKVIGQMLDYAANAVVYWPVDVLRAAYVETIASAGSDPDATLSDFLGPDRPADEFWSIVGSNLQSGKVRLLFVADEIPAELRRVVEFLNGQMSPAEVLALELRQYAGGDLRTIVPQVLGQTAQAATKKTSSVARDWDEASLLAELSRVNGSAAGDVGGEILAWAREQGCTVRWGHGASYGTANVHPPGRSLRAEQLFQLWSSGEIWVALEYLKRRPPFHEPQRRLALIDGLNEIPGVSFGAEMNERWPSVMVTRLVSRVALAQFLATMDKAIADIRAADSASGLSSSTAHPTA